MRRSPPPSPAAIEAVIGVLTNLQNGESLESLRAAPQRPTDLPAFARHLFNERRMREEALGRDLFSDPVWDMLLELYAATGEGEKIGINRASDASGVPATTALRYIKMMTQRGLVVRDDCPVDTRRVYLRLTDKTKQRMDELLSRMARDRLAEGPAGR